MLSILLTLLFAGSAAAQLTTSFAFRDFDVGTDKLGFYGSVVSLVDGHTAILVEFDNGVNTGVVGGFAPHTYTIGSTYFGLSQNIGTNSSSTDRTDINADEDDGFDLKFQCEWPASPPDASASCSVSYAPEVARRQQCLPP